MTRSYLMFRHAMSKMLAWGRMQSPAAVRVLRHCSEAYAEAPVKIRHVHPRRLRTAGLAAGYRPKAELEALCHSMLLGVLDWL